VIVDTSALIAILRDELEAPGCAKAIEAASRRRISAANFVEPRPLSTQAAIPLPADALRICCGRRSLSSNR